MTPEELAKIKIERWDIGDLIAFAEEELTKFYLDYPEEFRKELKEETNEEGEY